MITVRQFLDGKVLYDEIYTQYGPAYYFYEWLIHTLPGLPVTHDINRLTTLIVWTSTALICGIFTHRLTRSPIFSAISYVLTFLILYRTVYEPGHPQELCGLLIALILLSLTGIERGKSFYGRLAFAAAILAALFLIKINLGIFLGLALVIALMASTPDGRWQRAALIALTTLAVLLPFVMLREYLSFGWLKLSISIAVTVLSAVLTGSLYTKNTPISAKHYLICAASFLGTALLLVLFVSLRGTSLNALINGIFLQHLKFGENFFQAAPIQRFVIFWAVFAFILALGWTFFNKRYARTSEILLALLKIAFGLSICLCSLWAYERDDRFLNYFTLVSFAPCFLWLVLINPKRREESEKNHLAKIALVFTAVLLTLQIFPIPGTQMAYASFLMIVVAILCLHDGLLSLKHLFSQKAESFHLKIGLSAVAAIFIGVVCIHRFSANYNAFQQQIPVQFDGATRLRLPEKDAALYKFLVENLKSDCDNFVSMAGLFSLHFWTNIEPPTTYNATAWMTLLSDAQQQSIVNKLKTYPRVCAIYYPKMAQDGARNQDLRSRPLSAYILNDFKVRATVSEHRFMTEMDATEDLTYLARILPNQQIEFSLPNRRAWEIARVQVFDVRQKRSVSDSQTDFVTIFNQVNQPLNFPAITTENADSPQKYVLRLPLTNSDNLPKLENLLLRVFDGAGNLIASLPFDENR